MNRKRWIGLIILLAGIALMLFTNYQKGRVAGAKHDVNMGTSLFSGSPAGDAVGGVLKGKASQYDQTLMMMQYGSIALMIVGAAMVLFCRCRKK